jgi:hypothetical protein
MIASLKFRMICRALPFFKNLQSTSPTGSTLTYSIAPSTEFKINSATGQITTVGAVTTTGLRIVTVTATDANGLSSTASVQINVQGNAATGTCTSSLAANSVTQSINVASGASTAPAGSTVGTITPSGGTSPYTYTLLSGNFVVSAAGVVTTSTALAPGVYTGTVRVTDSTGASVVSTITLTVQSNLQNPTVNVLNTRCINGVFPALSNVATIVAATGTPQFTYSISPLDT